MSDPQTPLYTALCEYAAARPLRFHMPGHKGLPVFDGAVSAEQLDVTELPETGCLYEDAPPFSEANRLFAAAWNAPQAFVLAGGATLGIQAMLRCAFAGQENRRLLCDRGCHKSVYHAMALCDLLPEYLFCDRSGVPPFAETGADFDIKSLDEALSWSGARAVAVTSPTYYGVVRDIEAIAAVAHRHGALLLVDEAHGAHFPFLAGCRSAVSAGADMAVCSLHKTLPALGGAALLTAAGDVNGDEVRRALAFFGSSSPSFLIAASADAARARMETSREALAALVVRLDRLRAALVQQGVFVPLTAPLTAGGKTDPLRLTVCTAPAGLSGVEAAERLAAKGICCEMSDRENVVFILSAADTAETVAALEAALLSTARELLPAAPLPPSGGSTACRPLTACSPREAWMAASEAVAVAEAEGRVCAETVGRYPPGIPLIAPGEIVTAEILAALRADPAAYPQRLCVLHSVP